jgi:hypothetical protein
MITITILVAAYFLFWFFNSMEASEPVRVENRVSEDINNRRAS